MSVCYVVDRWPVLSETFVRDEIAAMRRLGIEVLLVALAHGDTDIDAPSADVVVEDARSWLARLTALARSPWRGVRARRCAQRMAPERAPWKTASMVAASLPPDVTHVHAHFAWAASAFAEVLAAHLGVPWSMTIHARDLFVDAGFLAAKLDRCPVPITVCEYNRGEVVRLARSAGERCHVVPCGVEPVQPGIAARGHDVGFDVVAVGRLVEKKGFDVLVDAVPALLATHPSLRVGIIGAGPEMAALDQRVTDHGLGHHVRLVGPLPHADTLAHISASAVLCMPARIAPDGDRDSMPLVIKEALARGVPVVASDLVGVPEVVDAQVGRLVPAEDAEAVTAALYELLANPDLARRLGEAGRRRIEECFTLDRQAARLASLMGLA